MSREKLVIYVKMPTGEWKRLPVVHSSNGKLKSGFAVIDDEPKRFEKYTYQLRSYVGRKTVYRNVGANGGDALDEAKRSRVRREAKAVNVAVVEDDGRLTLDVAITRYLQRCLKRESLMAHRSYEPAFQHLRDAAQITYVDEITEETVTRYHAHLRKLGHKRSTIANRHAHLRSLVMFCGWSAEKVRAVVGNAPKCDRKLVTAYSTDELSTLFAEAETFGDDGYMRCVLRLLQMTGMREREAMHLEWSDIDFTREEITITTKSDCRACTICRLNDQGFRLKNREERRVPLFPDLAAILRERRKQVPRARFVVGNGQDNPCDSWLHRLKRLARAAKLHCGHCKGCRSYERSRSDKLTWANRHGCTKWTIHNFRRTYATHLFRSGYQITDIRDLLGHADIDTTMRYLASASLDSHKAKMANVKWS